MDVCSVRSELAGLWQAALERVLAALQARGAQTTDAEASALRQLQYLRSFLPEGPRKASRLAERAPEQLQAGVAQLCDLLQSQARLAGSASPGSIAAGTALICQHLRRGLLQLAQDCRRSDWTLAHFVASGLARQCRQLTLLGHFSADPLMRQQLARIEQALILLHASTRPPPTAALARLQQQLLMLARGKPALAGWLHGASPQPPGPLDTLAQAELAQLQGSVQHLLQAQCEVNEALMIAVYRLTWLLQASAALCLADCGLLVYQLLVRHWQQREPLSAALRHLLESWLTRLSAPGSWQSAELDTTVLLPCMSAALAAWPDCAGEQGARVQLHLIAEASDLSIRQVPEHMAATLHALLQVEATWFADRNSWLQCRALLLPELQLLEQGAAALRLAALEQFSSLLLACYAQLDLCLPGQDWPGALLWQAHRELVATLDRAALWQEPVPAPQTLQALQAGLQCGEDLLQAALRDAASLAPGLYLAAALSLFGQQAGRVLGRSVRISMETPALLAEALVGFSTARADQIRQQLLALLQNSLRWWLLQPDSSAELRRGRRLPQATALHIALHTPGSADAAHTGVADAALCILELCVLERGARGLPGSKALQRLQRSLGPAARQLRCEQIPTQGRCLRFGLGDEPN